MGLEVEAKMAELQCVYCFRGQIRLHSHTYQCFPREDLQQWDQVMPIPKVFIQVHHMTLVLFQNRGNHMSDSFCARTWRHQFLFGKTNTLAFNRKPIIFDFYPIHQSDDNNGINVPCPGNSSNQMRCWKWLQTLKLFQLSWKHLLLDSKSVTQPCYICFLQESGTTLHRSRMHSREEPSPIPAPNVKRHLSFLTSDSWNSR